jgi:hypothetical protein
MIASVMSSLRKSWGANRSGWPAVSVSPVRARAMSSSCRMAWAVGQFLDADPGVPQDLHGGPGPEPAVFFEGEVAALPGAGLVSPDSRACLAGHH